jgi:outer membrane protein OmpA-like peptidoglycan-associated protein
MLGTHATPQLARTSGPRRPQPKASVLPWALAGLAALVGIGWLGARRANEQRASRTVTSIPNTELRPVAGQSVIVEMSSYLDDKNTAPKRFVLDGLEFETDSARLTADSRITADELADALKRHPHATVQVIGYTDAAGDPAHNLILSRERAAAIGTYLIDRGVDANRIKTAGMGSEHPLAHNDTEAARQKNRRVELVLLP